MSGNNAIISIFYRTVTVKFSLMNNLICDVMVSVLASIWQIVDSIPNRVKPKTIQLVFVAFPLSTHYQGERAKNLMARNHDVFEWGVMSIRRLLF